MIFPNLNKWVKKNSFLVFVLSMYFSGIFIWFMSLLIENKTNVIIERKGSNVSIVDIISKNDTVEFKLKNSGDDTAFLYEIKFYLRLIDFYDHCFYDRAPVTYYYELFIQTKIDKNSFSGRFPRYEKHTVLKPITLKISQYIPPKGIDRFQVIFFEGNRCFETIYQGHAIIYYDRNKSLKADSLVIINK